MCTQNCPRTCYYTDTKEAEAKLRVEKQKDEHQCFCLKEEGSVLAGPRRRVSRLRWRRKALEKQGAQFGEQSGPRQCL